MKKFLLFALCAIATCSLFAEPYSLAKYKEFKRNKKYLEAIAYCYESEISAETDYNHCYHYVNKLSIDKKFTLTKNEIDAAIKKFENAGKVTKQNLQSIFAAFYMKNGLINEAQQLAKLNNDIIVNRVMLENGFSTAMKRKNTELMWNYGKRCLTIDGGYENVNGANKILTNMFRYKPSTITKEQQIEFLSKLAEIYPIPGTDFNKWKSFMGFVGFKYKQLTGKELF